MRLSGLCKVLTTQTMSSGGGGGAMALLLLLLLLLPSDFDLDSNRMGKYSFGGATRIDDDAKVQKEVVIATTWSFFPFDIRV